MGRAKQTQGRLIDQRARRRADTELRARYRDEWDAIYVLEKIKAEDEAELLVQAQERVKAIQPSHRHPEPEPEEPPRLMPGRRLSGQTTLDRIDVARCAHCVRYHDRGHKCTRCGAQPPGPQRGVHPEQIRWLATQGLRPARIAERLGVSLSTVTKVLEGRIAKA